MPGLFVFAMLGLGVASVAVSLALLVVVPVVLTFLSVFFGPKLRDAAGAVRRAGHASNRALGTYPRQSACPRGRRRTSEPRTARSRARSRLACASTDEPEMPSESRGRRRKRLGAGAPKDAACSPMTAPSISALAESPLIRPERCREGLSLWTGDRPRADRRGPQGRERRIFGDRRRQWIRQEHADEHSRLSGSAVARSLPAFRASTSVIVRRMRARSSETA